MPTQLKTRPVDMSTTSEYAFRVLFLSGRWEKPGSEFSFRATIYIEKDGSADGAIYWRAYKVAGQPSSYFATESVHGGVNGAEVELEGHDVEAGLAPDSYKIALSGSGEAGTFAGITRANNWGGKMEGTFQFRNRKA